jgi:hypothetical protein
LPYLDWPSEYHPCWQVQRVTYVLFLLVSFKNKFYFILM